MILHPKRGEKMKANAAASDVNLESISLKRKTEFLRLARASKAFHQPGMTPISTEPQFLHY